MMEIQIDGDELDVECPRCDGEGKTTVPGWGYRECPTCDGKGIIEDIPCYGEIYVDLEPTRMEGL